MEPESCLVPTQLTGVLDESLDSGPAELHRVDEVDEEDGDEPVGAEECVDHVERYEQILNNKQSEYG